MLSTTTTHDEWVSVIDLFSSVCEIEETSKEREIRIDGGKERERERERE